MYSHLTSAVINERASYSKPTILTGTIFTGKRMGSENMALVRKFSSVFARRIAATAQPDPCQNCECATDENGIEYLDCLPCSIPIPAYADFVSSFFASVNCFLSWYSV